MPETSRATATAPASSVETATPLFDSILKKGRLRDREQAKGVVREFITQVKNGQIVRETADQTIAAWIQVIDNKLTEQLNEILHHEKFQKLEASWRGLKYLLDKSNTSDMLKIKIFNVTKDELLRDFRAAVEFDQNALFKKIYEEEFGQFGGAPFAALLGDFEFGIHPKTDMELLPLIAQVSAAAHAPFISAASPNLLRMDSFTELGGPPDIAKVFDSTEYVKWRSFRDSEDSRYVGLVLPHILLRLPYHPEDYPVEAFNYQEDVDGKDHSKYLWGNAAYALAAKLTDAFSKFGWCAAIRGVEGGGLVEGLPAHTFPTDKGDVALKCPTEIAISDRREKELANQGLISLLHCKNTDFAAFFSVQSCNKPSQYSEDSANDNAQLSAQLPYILAVSRFAHYMKAMMRDKIGSFASRVDCQRFLNQWIAQYVTPDDTAEPSVKAQHPLREATIEVADVPGKPGVYRAIAFLRPHFQLDELTVSLRLVAELPAPARR